MALDSSFLAEIDRCGQRRDRAGTTRSHAILTEFAADSGTIHLLGDDGVLHLEAASAGHSADRARHREDVPVGKGMAGLAVERRQPVNACNIQTDASGDVRPGARATGLQGSIVVPMLRGDAPSARLASRIAASGRSRTRRPSAAGRRPRAGARDIGDVRVTGASGITPPL